MTTQFFERQDSARGQTTRLIFLFILAVIAIVVALSVVGFIVATLINESQSRRLPPGSSGGINPLVMAFLFGVGSLVVIGLGSMYQISALRFGGGTRVAESVGGRQLAHHTSDPLERRLLNIVEEMAIASGTAVPPVYLMEEDGINAFAAGYNPGDAVIGVTRGAIANLSRDELQGVIAHEFSHVFNGDMRTNIRMIGILHGILILSLIGQMLLRSLYFVNTGSRDKNSGGIVIALLAMAVVLIVLGFLGSFLGGLIKAAISRQREFLADASAVQFTRNPHGISGALKRIGGMVHGSRVQHANATMASHMYFAQGVFEGLSGLMATHPPLPKRIAAIDPKWDGQFLEGAADTAPRAGQAFSAKAKTAPVSGMEAAGMAGLAPTARMAELEPTRQAGRRQAAGDRSRGDRDADAGRYSTSEMMAAPEHVGQPKDDHQAYASRLLQEMDPVLVDAAHDPYSARALVMALLVDDDKAIAEKQFQLLQRMVSVDLLNAVAHLVPHVRQIPSAGRLPLVDMSLPMLRMMSLQQYQSFIPAFQAMVQADDKISVFEWTLSQVLYRHLHSHYSARPVQVTHYYSLGTLTKEVSVLLSVLARAGNPESQVMAAMQAGMAKLPTLSLELVSREASTFPALEAALDKLAKASGKLRHEVLTACSACVSADGLVKVREAELVRGIADLLDCPMPPLVGRQE